MSHFERRTGEAVTLRLDARGVSTLRVSVTGVSTTRVDDPGIGATTPAVPLLTTMAIAEGATALRIEHEFRAGQLDEFDELRVDPVVYGRAGGEYELSVALGNASDAEPTVVDSFTGTLVPSRRNADDGTGFDAPPCIVQLTSAFGMHWDERAGAFILDVKVPVFPVDTFDAILGGTVQPSVEPLDIESIEPIDFHIGGPGGTSPGAGYGSGLGSLGTGGRSGGGLGAGGGFGSGVGG